MSPPPIFSLTLGHWRDEVPTQWLRGGAWPIRRFEALRASTSDPAYCPEYDTGARFSQKGWLR